MLQRSWHRLPKYLTRHGPIYFEIPSLSHQKPPAFYLFQTRYKSWFSPFKSKSQIIIEEPENSPQLLKDARFQDINHTIKTTDITNPQKREILNEKLQLVISDVPFDNHVLDLVNTIFMELYKLDNYTVKFDDTTTLLHKSAEVILAESLPVLPEFLSIIIQHALKSQTALQTQDLVYITLLASKLTNSNISLNDTLVLLIRSNRTLDKLYFEALIDYYHTSNTLQLNVFETISQVCKDHHQSLDDVFFNRLILYIEKLFEKPPRVHEYKDLERSVPRVQLALTTALDSFKPETASIETTLNLLRVSHELLQVSHNSNLASARNEILDYLMGVEFNDVFLRQPDELLVSSFLELCLETGYSKLYIGVFDLIVDNSMFFSAERVVQANLFKLKELPEEQLYGKIVQHLQDSDTDPTALLLNVLQAFVTPGIVLPNGFLVQNLMQKFGTEIDLPVMSYKICIDRAIADNNGLMARELFDRSLGNFTQWSEDLSPKICRTLNDLIVISCNDISDIQELFLFFTTVKQQMKGRLCDINVVTELSKRMLGEELVGDCIEMLKRELPAIKKNSPSRLPLNEPFGQDYMALFNVLHDFITTYTNEETFETNWVLYGQLHKIFHVPYDSYLPAMKFFCSHGRLNASLVILRHIRGLSENHGNHNHLPPLKDMYMYLFQEFGDKLYEDGVNEVHEFLKTDISLPKQDIELQNSILNAYSNLQEVGKTRDLFLSMNPMKRIDGKSVINEKTVQIMLKTYTYSDLNYVKTFWNNLSTFGIYPNYDIFRQYLIAHVYHGFTADAIELTNEMNDFDLEVSTDTLASMYNFCLTSKHQDDIEKWAEKAYPEIWESAVQKNLLKRSDDYVPETSMLLEGVSDTKALDV